MRFAIHPICLLVSFPRSELRCVFFNLAEVRFPVFDLPIVFRPVGALVFQQIRRTFFLAWIHTQFSHPLFPIVAFIGTGLGDNVLSNTRPRAILNMKP
jgi:hypothetical protein